MDAKNQFAYFCLSIAVGFCGGLIYEIFAVLRFVFGCEHKKRKTVGLILDLIFGTAFASFAIYTAFLLKFPSFREYMCIGYAIGGIIYAKTLRRILAFYKKVCYNVFARMVKKAKKQRKTLRIEGVDI